MLSSTSVTSMAAVGRRKRHRKAREMVKYWMYSISIARGNADEIEWNLTIP